MLRFRVSELVSREEFLRIGEGSARLIEQHLGLMGVNLAQARRVLDFGCGCGRALRWFLRDYPDPEFHGVDVDEEAVEWCRQHLKAAQFFANNPEPPLPYPDRHFDIIYCLSVFTHLDELMQDAWLAELARLLAPGGVLLLTVHGERAAQVLDQAGLETLRTAGFVHQRSRKLKGIVPDWYQTTWHSREYILNRLTARFVDIRYHPLDDSMQVIVMARSR
jgi:SAM-dependent methyltransferase